MKFEWDDTKRRINLKKHALDFRDAHVVFNDEALILEDPHNDYNETRYLLQGTLEQHIVIIVFTVRDDDVIRIISMRKANKRERQNYVTQRFG